MKIRARGAAPLIALTMVVASAVPAAAYTWTAYHKHTGGVAWPGTSGDCTYSYDAMFGSTGHAYSQGNSTCTAERVRHYYYVPSTGWSGYTSWVVDTGGWAETPTTPNPQFSEHYVDN